MKPSKQTRQLPGRGSLNDLGKSQRTVLDYSKASPITQREPSPAVILNLVRRGK